MKRSSLQTRKIRTQGFTLLEALIALLVLSIGLLGLAGLQVTGTRLSTEAHMRTLTTLAATEIIEKIRVRTGRVERALRPTVIDQYIATSHTLACDAGIGDVANDMGCWWSNIDAQIPGGTGELADGDVPGSVAVTISWFDRETEETRSVEWTFIVGS